MAEVLNNLFGSETKTGSTGYHGGIVSDVPEMQLQKCSENTIDPNFSLDNTTSLNSDPATVLLEIQQSRTSIW